MHMDDIRGRKTRIALVSVVANALLVVLKLAIGFLMGSVSVISEAIHSALDLVAAGIALFAVRQSDKPADEKHPFGHGKVENISGAIEALLIFVAAAWIIREAIRKFVHLQPIESLGWGMGVMFFSSAVNVVVSTMLFRVSRATGSVALEADAWHLLTDVYTSAGVMVALGFMWAGDRVAPGLDLRWVDPLAAMAVAALIVRAALRLTIKAGHDLLDGRLPPEEDEWMMGLLRARIPPIKDIHNFRTRRSGSTRIIEVHVRVDPAMTVEESHRITDEIKGEVRIKYPGSEVTIHVEPENWEGEGSVDG